MKIRGVDFIMYPVSDLARAAKFYRDFLGLPQEVYSEEWQWAEFNCGNLTLSLKGGEKLPEPVTGGHIALAVDDVQAVCKELKRQGVRIVKEPQDFGCCQAMEILDPDGNHVILHRRADGTFGPNLP
jgi:predicted enzyme related to lactoylglutathione lyase